MNDARPSDTHPDVREFVESAASFHARVPGIDRQLQVWWSRTTDRAIVLGSTQSDEVVDRRACRDANFDVVRRRSGGGVVLVGGGSTVWIDVVVPRGHHLWSDDIDRSALWLGRCWERALGALGVADLRVHEGAMERPTWSREVCFVGRAAGEVLAGASKAVGISQRRTRDWCRLQSSLSLRWEAEVLRRLLADPRPPVDVLRGAGTDLALDENAVGQALIEQVRLVA